MGPTLSSIIRSFSCQPKNSEKLERSVRQPGLQVSPQLLGLESLQVFGKNIEEFAI